MRARLTVSDIVALVDFILECFDFPMAVHVSGEYVTESSTSTNDATRLGSGLVGRLI